MSETIMDPVEDYKLVNNRRYRITSLLTQMYCVLICGFLIGFGNVSGASIVISEVTNDSVVFEINEVNYVPGTVSFHGTQVSSGFSAYLNKYFLID